MNDNFLGFLGLLKKSGKLITGADNCIGIIKSKSCAYAFCSSDISANSLKKITDAVFGSNIKTIKLAYTKNQLASALGTGECAVFCIDDRKAEFSVLNKADILN